ncbi:MAG: photosynthetic complex assembly protein PuhC [Phreatobacter sp.]|jgi:putative photosynthetic complex assembly protein|uniref:photosynthetic complex assembly protein PuhC n=1 Tax=Phreatobacter sp. TaxID=1966341 RepID=UPI0040369814
MTAATHVDIRFRTWPVMAAGVVVALAILAAGLGRYAGLGTVAVPASPAVEAKELLFQDTRDGSITVLDAADRKVVLVVPLGEGGFMRGVMRGLARDRKMRGLGPDLPFRIERRQNGMVILVDLATGREIALGSFGQTNLEAFSRLLPNKDGSR